MKKILHLIHSGGLYGAENVIINLSLALKKKNCESIVGCFIEEDRKPELGKKAESLGLHTVYFKMKNGFDPRCLFDLARFCKNKEINIIHSHGYKSSVICMVLKYLFGFPYVITCHLWFIDSIRLRFYTLFERLSMSFANSVIGVSNDIVNTLMKAGVPTNKIFLIENGIEVDEFARFEHCKQTELKNELSLQEDSLIVGSLGRLTEQKDYGTFIRAADEILKINEQIEFIVAGDGHLKNKLLSLCKTSAIENRFHFLGFREDTASILKIMDIFVLTSLDEGLPIAMLEAMASGLPIVTTGVGAIPDVIVNGRNGILFEKGDFKGLKEILLTLISEPDIRKRLGTAAYHTARTKYSNERMAEQYLVVYHPLAS